MDVFTAVIGFMWLAYFWETYLARRQHKVYEKTLQLPQELNKVIDEDVFEKSRTYAIDKSSYSFWNGLYSQVENTLILWFGGIPWLWFISGQILQKFGYGTEYEILHSMVFSLLGSIISLVLELPWTLYFTFVIEERHGFNKMSLGFFFKDLLKKTIVSQAISMPLMALVIYIVQAGGEYFYIYAWLAVLAITMVLMHVYPEYIAPLFDKYNPLPDGDLKTKIEELAASLDFPLKKLYVVEGSKRSAHSNAYMYGFHKNKRIVLFDTLLEDYTPVGRKDADVQEKEKDEQEHDKADQGDGAKNLEQGEKESCEEKSEVKKIGCNTEEVVAVLAHELGHWKFSHMVKNIFIMQANILFSFFLFGQLMNISSLFSAFGFTGQQPVLIRLFIVFSFIFSPINEIESFLMHILSRRFEFQADEFAVKLGKKEKLKSALLKLFKDNLSFPVADWLYSARHFSHPPLLERLRGMDAVAYKRD